MYKIERREKQKLKLQCVKYSYGRTIEVKHGQDTARTSIWTILIYRSVFKYVLQPKYQRYDLTASPAVGFPGGSLGRDGGRGGGGGGVGFTDEGVEGRTGEEEPTRDTQTYKI